MANNSLYQVYFNYELKTKEEAYAFISDIVCQDNPLQKKEVIDQLNEREKAGSILIAEHVLLPHIESSQIKKSQILFIRLAQPILSWDDETKDIRLLIVILLKENECEQIKRNIALFTRTLADEEYLNRLITIHKEENFYSEINKKQEELS